MNPGSKKNRELIRQYPFIMTGILSSQLEPLGSCGTDVDDLTIRAEKADGDLMFRRANNIGLQGDESCVFSLKNGGVDAVGRRGEYILAVDHDGEVIGCLSWPRNEHERRMLGKEGYARMVFWSDDVTPSFRVAMGRKPNFDEVKHLVWVTVETWHVDLHTDNFSDRFGNILKRSVSITIYNEPDEGFEKLYETANVFDNLSLDSRLLMRGVGDNNHDIIAMSGMLGEMCVTFQDEVFFNGMKDVLDNGEWRGASGRFDSVKVLCAEMCGYDRVMLEDPRCWVSFQLRPDAKTMYVLGMSGTIPQVRTLVRTVVRMWRENPEARAAFKPDKEVSVL